MEQPQPESKLESEREYLARINGQLVKLTDMAEELEKQSMALKRISFLVDIIAVIMLLGVLLAILFN